MAVASGTHTRTRVWNMLLALCVAFAPAPDVNAVVVDKSKCPPVTSAALQLGIDMVNDLSCSEGGVGCVSYRCRLCRLFDTVHSQKYLLCSSFAADPTPAASAEPVVGESHPETLASGVCPVKVSPGDAAVGIDVITDLSCASGGLGCFEESCRYCKTRSTIQSEHWLRCSDLLKTQEPGPASTLATSSPPIPAPTLAPTISAAPAPAPIPAPTIAAVPAPSPVPVPISDTCTYVASPEDTMAGIAVVTDPSCQEKGGLGCLHTVCRLCKFASSELSSHLMDCDSFPSFDPGTPAPAPAATAAPTLCPTTPAPPPTVTPLPATESPSQTDQDLFETPRNNYCSMYLIDEERVSAGVWAFVDEDGCLADPTRCVLEFCRFCKFAESSASTGFDICPSDTTFDDQWRRK